MSTPFQNRLVGTIIISAAAVIFLPNIFDGEKQSAESTFGKIPQAPEYTGIKEVKKFPTVQLNQLPKQEISNDVAVDDENSKIISTKDDTNNEHSKVATLTPEKKFVSVKTDQKSNKVVSLKSNKEETTPAKIIEKGWVIQLGSFRHKKNVALLVASLKKAGYVVFTKPIKTHSGVLTKVFIGPELNKATLTKQLPALKKLTKMSGKIAKFNPTK